jgi:hypothetical protein
MDDIRNEIDNLRDEIASLSLRLQSSTTKGSVSPLNESFRTISAWSENNDAIIGSEPNTSNPFFQSNVDTITYNDHHPLNSTNPFLNDIKENSELRVSKNPFLPSTDKDRQDNEDLNAIPTQSSPLIFNSGPSSDNPNSIQSIYLMQHELIKLTPKMSLHKFFTLFEKQAALKYGKENKLNFQLALEECLTGQYLRLFQAYGGADVDYNSMKTYLLSCYQMKKNVGVDQHHEDFWNASMHPNEEFMLYSARLMALYEKAYPAVLPETSKELCKKYIKTLPVLVGEELVRECNRLRLDRNENMTFSRLVETSLWFEQQHRSSGVNLAMKPTEDPKNLTQRKKDYRYGANYANPDKCLSCLEVRERCICSTQHHESRQEDAGGNRFGGNSMQHRPLPPPWSTPPQPFYYPPPYSPGYAMQAPMQPWAPPIPRHNFKNNFKNSQGGYNRPSHSYRNRNFRSNNNNQATTSSHEDTSANNIKSNLN